MSKPVNDKPQNGGSSHAGNSPTGTCWNNGNKPQGGRK